MYMLFHRCWEGFPPFPSTRQKAAKSTWVRTPSTATLSVQRAQRWTSWFHKMKNMWVSKIRFQETVLVVPWWSLNVQFNPTVFKFFPSGFIFLIVLQREFPVPEQFKTVWDGSKLVTEPTEIAGWLLIITNRTSIITIIIGVFFYFIHPSNLMQF